jgi:hypothetical protein
LGQFIAIAYANPHSRNLRAGLAPVLPPPLQPPHESPITHIIRPAQAAAPRSHCCSPLSKRKFEPPGPSNAIVPLFPAIGHRGFRWFPFNSRIYPATSVPEKRPQIKDFLLFIERVVNVTDTIWESKIHIIVGIREIRKMHHYSMYTPVPINPFANMSLPVHQSQVRLCSLLSFDSLELVFKQERWCIFATILQIDSALSIPFTIQIRQTSLMNSGDAFANSAAEWICSAT